MQHLIIGDSVIAHRIRMLLGIFVINTIDLRALENRLTGHFAGPQCGRSIGGEIGIPGARCKNHHPLFFQMTHCAAANIGFTNLIHWDGRDNSGMNALPFQRTLHRQRVHNRGQHAHVIGSGALHSLRRALQASEDITATDDHADFSPKIMNRFDLSGNPLHGRRMKTVSLISHQSLTRNF